MSAPHFATSPNPKFPLGSECTALIFLTKAWLSGRAFWLQDEGDAEPIEGALLQRGGGRGFVELDRRVGRQAPVRRHALADDVDPIEGGLARDGGLVALGTEAGVGDLEREVLADLAPPEHLPDPEGDASLAAERPPGALGGGGDRGQVA